MLRSRDDSIAGRAATEGGAVSLFLEVCVLTRQHKIYQCT